MKKPQASSTCGQILAQPVTAGQSYMLLVSTPQTSVQLRRGTREFGLAVAVTGGEPGAELEFEQLNPTFVPEKNFTDYGATAPGSE